MRTMVWTIGVVVLVDLTVVAWFVTRELIERQRARREVALLDEMWREPAVAVVRPRRSAAPGSAWEAARSAVVVSTLERPVLADRPGASRASLTALVTALTTLIVVLGFDAAAPPTERAAGEGTAPDLAWSFDPDVERGDAVSPEGTSPPSGERAGAPPPSADGSSGVGGAPAPTPGPDRVDAAPRSADRIVLAWRPVEDASGYLIERRGELVTPGWELIATTAAGATTYVDRGLEAETTYWYRVSAVTEQGPAPSEVVSATTLPVTPEAPVIVATANGIAVEVGWTDVAGESAYRIERWSNVTGGWVVIGTVGQDVTSYVDGALEPGVTYDYRVVATNESGESPASNVASATTSAVDGTSVEPAPSAGDVLPEPEVSD